MSMFESQNLAARPTAVFDEGLRAYMLRVYNLMAGALAATGITAYVTAQSGLYVWLAQTGLVWLAMIAPLGIVFYFSFRLHAMSRQRAQTVFWIFAVLMGLSLGSVFLFYTGASITRVFFVTSAAFGGLSLYGYTTKRNLSALGSFFIMALWGLVIGLVVNFFLQSAAFDFALSVMGVLIFAGLTAYDTQKIKGVYYQTAGAAREKMAILGALRLYLDFLNLFLFLLRFLGERR